MELMGFTYEMVMLLRAKNSPTMSLLEEWELREGNGATLESLIVMMEELENGSALQVLQQVKESLHDRPPPRSPLSPLKPPFSCSSFSSDPVERSSTMVTPAGRHCVPSLKPYIDPINLQHQNGSTSTNSSDCERVQEQLSSLSLDHQNGDFNKKEAIGDDGIEVMIRDRSLSELDRSLLIDGSDFDIFLSFAPADAEFADEMRLRLINRAGISVYIASEGLMPGQSFIDEVADKIKRGCRKTIIILSPDYNQCSWCNYEARLAHHKNPDPRGHNLIPIMYRKCEVPNFMSHLFYLDFTRYKDDHRQCEQYFWDRLYRSIRHQQPGHT